MKPIQLVLVSSEGRHLYIRNLEQDYHCQYGMIKKEDLQSIKEAAVLKTNKGNLMPAFKPSFLDLYRKIQRSPQIIPLKDVGTIITETGITKQTVVVDAGTGSGALAIYLAKIAQKVTSYEVRADFALVANMNAKALSLANLTIKNKDIYKGMDEKNVDVITLDLPEPWNALDAASNSLKAGGYVASYSPTTPQVSDFVAAAEKKGFIHMKTIEVIQREWEFKQRVVRPKSQAIGHSGFITILRKVK